MDDYAKLHELNQSQKEQLSQLGIVIDELKTLIKKYEGRLESKDQLVSIINKYWLLLKNSAESNMNDKINYRIEEFGRIRMTSVNMLRNLINYHASKTK